MRWTFLGVGIVVGLVPMALVLAQRQSGPARDEAASSKSSVEKGSKTTGKKSHEADEAEIRANVAKFVKAYNGQNAKAVAQLFTPDGQTIDKDGQTSEGREAIEKTFKEIFEANPRKELETSIESISFIGSDLAVEVGSTKETNAPGELPEYDRYTVLHVKRDGKWQMALARDEEGQAPTNHEQLLPLAWLVGDWVDDGGNVVIQSSCHWSEDGNFLLEDFKLEIDGKKALQVSQRIGWDPLTKSVHSWVFDSEGGYGQSAWTRDGDSWVIKATGVRPDGKTASATNVLVPAGKDAYVWRTSDRIVGDEVLEPVEVKVVRTPPEAKQ